MNHRSIAVNYPRQALTLFVMLTAFLFSAVALAQGTAPATASTSLSPQAQYKLDVERCNTGQTNQDKATCMREAGAALEEARRNHLTNAQPQNATERCNALPADQRQDCLMQMSGQNTKVEGSIEAGGVLRETTLTVPAAPTPPTAPDTSTMPVSPSGVMK
jgi:hypothetical protein